MIILFLVAGEVASIIVTLRLSQKVFTDIILEVGKHGYKFDKKICSLSLNKQEKSLDGDNHQSGAPTATKTKKGMGSALLFIPVVNIIGVQLMRRKIKKDVMSYTELSDFILPMNDNEKSEYSKLKNNSDRLAFSFFIMSHDLGNAEFAGYSDGNLKIHDRNIVLTAEQRLEPLAYTLDEVKKLNRITNYSYKLGTLNGINTAIIGVQDLSLVANKIKLISNYSLTENEFVEMNDEDGKDKTFIVYSVLDECHDKMQNGIDEIISRRTYGGETKTSQYLSNMQQGPVLKRTKKI